MKSRNMTSNAIKRKTYMRNKHSEIHANIQDKKRNKKLIRR